MDESNRIIKFPTYLVVISCLYAALLAVWRLHPSF